MDNRIRLRRAIADHRRAVEEYGEALRSGAEDDTRSVLLSCMRRTDLELTEAIAPFIQAAPCERGMDDEIAIKDVHGLIVRVTVTAAVQAVGDTLLDDETLWIPRTKVPLKYVRVSIAEDSEVPG